MIRKIKRIINLIIVLIIIFGAYFVFQVYFPLSPRGSEELFIVEEGNGVNQISYELYRAGFIKSQLVFETYVWLLRAEGKLTAGEHRLNKGANIKSVAENLMSIKNLERERNITFIEGWTLRDLAAYLKKENLIKSEEELYSLTGEPGLPNTEFYNFGGEYDFLEVKPGNLSLEGYIYPDTYRIFKDASAEDILRKALDNFNKKLSLELREEMRKQSKTINEVLTLASIVEREARSSEDKKMISDIFLKRLNAGMPLQSDATVNYITGAKSLQPTFDEINVDSPYNTYKYKGLPPGPISGPSISSIEAVLYPTPNDYWYFLTTLDDGRVIYSKTYDEHVANKQKYLK